MSTSSKKPETGVKMMKIGRGKKQDMVEDRLCERTVRVCVVERCECVRLVRVCVCLTRLNRR